MYVGRRFVWSLHNRDFSVCKVVSLDEVSKLGREGDGLMNSVLWVRSHKDLEGIKVKNSIVLISDGGLTENLSGCLFLQSHRSRDIFGKVTNVIGEISGFRNSIVLRDAEYGYTVWNNVEIAEDVVVGPGTSIGGPGFGYYRDYDDKRKRFAHLGGCTIRGGCEIAACVTIDSGTLRPTFIDREVKIDSNVHIGHNAIVGAGTIICASVTICGSVEIGEDVFIGAGAIIMDKVKIPAGSIVGLGSVVRRTPKDKGKIIPVFENKFRRI